MADSEFPSGAWPPPPNLPGYAPVADENTSGLRQGIPPSVEALRWNWGAFSLSFLWSLNHKLVAAGLGMLALGIVTNVLSRINPILGLFGLVQFGVSIYFGLNGNKWAWENRRFPGGYSEFIAVQKAWMVWGIVLFTLSMIVVLASLVLPMVAHETVGP